MALKYKTSGETIMYTAGADVESGDVVVVGDRVGIALTDIANGATGPVALRGVWTVTALGTDDIAVGKTLYWDAGNSRATLTASTHKKIGTAAAASGSLVTTVDVELHP